MFNWKNKNVLITGVNGFVGSNLCKKLIDLDANIFGTINNNSTKSLLNYENLIKKINIIGNHKNNFLYLKDIIKNYEIEYIYHIAAQVEVIKANNDPFFTLSNNITYTLELLEAAKLSGKNKLFYLASTDKVYGEIEKNKLPYKEAYKPNPKFPYDVSKYICELLSLCYKNNYSLPIIIGRTCNLYGPGQLNFSALIPSLINTALNDKQFIPRSNGKTLRDYMFIDDWVNTLVSIPYKSINGKNNVYNFGNNTPISTIDIAEIIFRISNYAKRRQVINDFKMTKMDDYEEINFQYLDSEKAKVELGFNPKISIEKGLEKTLEWYKKYI